jgi:hypothetical protein
MGTQFDPVIAEAFLSIVAREGGQFIVNSALNVRQHTTDQLLMSPPVESFDPTTREAQIDSVTR